MRASCAARRPACHASVFVPVENITSALELWPKLGIFFFSVSVRHQLVFIVKTCESCFLKVTKRPQTRNLEALTPRLLGLPGKTALWSPSQGVLPSLGCLVGGAAPRDTWAPGRVRAGGPCLRPCVPASLRTGRCCLGAGMDGADCADTLFQSDSPRPPQCASCFSARCVLGTWHSTSVRHLDTLGPAGPQVPDAQSLWWGPFQDPENSRWSADLMGVIGTACHPRVSLGTC